MPSTTAANPPSRIRDRRARDDPDGDRREAPARERGARVEAPVGHASHRAIPSLARTSPAAVSTSSPWMPGRLASSKASVAPAITAALANPSARRALSARTVAWTTSVGTDRQVAGSIRWWAIAGRPTPSGGRWSPTLPARWCRGTLARQAARRRAGRRDDRVDPPRRRSTSRRWRPEPRCRRRHRSCADGPGARARADRRASPSRRRRGRTAAPAGVPRSHPEATAGATSALLRRGGGSIGGPVSSGEAGIEHRDVDAAVRPALELAGPVEDRGQRRADAATAAAPAALRRISSEVGSKRVRRSAHAAMRSRIRSPGSAAAPTETSRRCTDTRPPIIARSADVERLSSTADHHGFPDWRVRVTTVTRGVGVGRTRTWALGGGRLARLQHDVALDVRTEGAGASATLAGSVVGGEPTPASVAGATDGSMAAASAEAEAMPVNRASMRRDPASGRRRSGTVLAPEPTPMRPEGWPGRGGSGRDSAPGRRPRFVAHRSRLGHQSPPPSCSCSPSPDLRVGPTVRVMVTCLGLTFGVT